MNISSHTTLISIGGVCVLVVAALAYLFVPHGAEPSSAVSVSATSTPPAELTFINLAAQLDSIAFDTSILSDPRFTTLVDIRTAILPEASGRSDPFAPLPGLVVSQ